jgi:hypothetical protein
MKGRRVYPDMLGFLPPLEPGDYGRATAKQFAERHPSMLWWQVCAPDATQGSLNPAIHIVDEHPDGTITVSPSIDFSQRRIGGYHGYLVKGEWS